MLRIGLDSALPAFREDLKRITEQKSQPQPLRPERPRPLPPLVVRPATLSIASDARVRLLHSSSKFQFQAQFERQSFFAFSALGRQQFFCVLISKPDGEFRVFETDLTEQAMLLKPTCLCLALVQNQSIHELAGVIGSLTGKISVLTIKAESIVLSAVKLCEQPISCVSALGQLPKLPKNIVLASTSRLALFIVDLFRETVLAYVCAGQNPPGTTFGCAFTQTGRSALAFHSDGTIALFPLKPQLFQAAGSCPQNEISCAFFKSAFSKNGLKLCSYQSGLIWGLDCQMVLSCIALETGLEDQFLCLLKVMVRPVLDQMSMKQDVVRLVELGRGVGLVTSSGSLLVVEDERVSVLRNSGQARLWLSKDQIIAALLVQNHIKIALKWTLPK